VLTAEDIGCRLGTLSQQVVEPALVGVAVSPKTVREQARRPVSTLPNPDVCRVLEHMLGIMSGSFLARRVVRLAV
jgi:hypothetical protein